MSDLRLKSITLRNWMTVKSARVEFPEQGFILVTGSNLASDGKLQSVGAGKTALGEALARTLLGVNGRFTHLGYFLSEGVGSDMYVKVDAELKAKPLVVEMGFKCKELKGEGEGLRFTYDTQPPFQAAKVDLTRHRLEQTLRVTPELASWTAFLDGGKMQFNKMSQENSVNLLMVALAQPPWTDYFEASSKKLASANQQLAISERTLQSAKTKVEVLEDNLCDALDDHKAALQEYQRQVDEHDQAVTKLKNTLSGNRGAITEAAKRLKEIKVRLAKLEEEKAAQNHQWEIEKQGLRDQLAEADVTWDELTQKRSTASSHYNRTNEDYAEMQKVPKTCPKCGKPWDKAHGEDELKKMEVAVQAALDAYYKEHDAWKLFGEKRSKINARINELDELMRKSGKVGEVRDLGSEYDRVEILVAELTQAVQNNELQIVRLEKGVDNNFVNKKFAVLEERTKSVEAAKKDIETAARDLAADQQVVKIIHYWYKAFSPTGIPNMILSNAVPLLNRVAQRISNLMTGGTLEISYSTTRELVRGDTKAQLVTKVSNKIGSKRIEGNSKGESGLTNLIIAENLSEVGQVSSRIGFRWYDEALPNQDPVVRKNIYMYLRDVARRYGILVFLVDHNGDAQNYADHVLMAEKTIEHGTRYRWL